MSESESQQNKLTHPSFPQVENPDTPVWRYMDIAKLVALIERRSLHFTRVDLMEDKFEATLTAPIVRDRDFQILNFGPADNARRFLDQMIELTKQGRRCHYINCWRLDWHESEAMWKLYCGSFGGVAIRTTYGKLVQSIEHDPYLYIGKVTYIDYRSDGFPLNNTFNAVMHKRISFKHESEVRLVKTLPEHWSLQSGSGPTGLDVPWDFERVVEAVYVSPHAPEYYFNALKSILDKFAPKIAEVLMWSDMGKDPVC